ncbi:MAG: Tim44/TimA family putative adaptor protein [Alphaproteobacteria bacterium]|nr:Tim44/TimA family putative adaptor protein [Alphaproteobacteria bacterium]
MNLPPDILLYALIAAGLIFWLKSMLGVEDDSDPQDKPGEKPGKKTFFLDQDEEDAEGFPLARSKNDAQNKVARLNVGMGAKFDLPSYVRIENKTAEIALENIAQSHPEFDLAHFVEGAKGAYIMVVEAFADKDRDTLENLLARQVYDAFEGAITAQEKAGERIDVEVQAVRKIDIVGADSKNGMVHITLRFTASERRAIYNKKDELIAGHPSDLAEMLDIWTFTRDMTDPGPEWMITETRSEEEEGEEKSAPDSKATKKTAKKSSKKTAKSKKKESA